MQLQDELDRKQDASKKAELEFHTRLQEAEKEKSELREENEELIEQIKRIMKQQ